MSLTHDYILFLKKFSRIQCELRTQYKLLFTLTLHNVRKRSINSLMDKINGQNPVPPYIFVLFKKLFHKIYITKNRKENYHYFRFMPILFLIKNSSICNNHNLIDSNDSENSFIFEIDQGILMKEKDFNQLRKWFIAQLVEPQ